MIMARGNGLYMGLILAWAVPVALMLWYVSNFPWVQTNSDAIQESRVSVHYTTSAVNNSPTNCGTDTVFVDRRYAGIETRHLGH